MRIGDGVFMTTLSNPDVPVSQLCKGMAQRSTTGNTPTTDGEWEPWRCVVAVQVGLREGVSNEMVWMSQPAHLTLYSAALLPEEWWPVATANDDDLAILRQDGAGVCSSCVRHVFVMCSSCVRHVLVMCFRVRDCAGALLPRTTFVEGTLVSVSPSLCLSTVILNRCAIACVFSFTLPFSAFALARCACVRSGVGWCGCAAAATSADVPRLPATVACVLGTEVRGTVVVPSGVGTGLLPRR